MSSSELDTLKTAFQAAGGHWSTFLIWAKNTFTLGRSDYQRQYEPILYGWAEGRPHYWCGARDQGDVWFIDRPAVNDLHPTMKPVALMERAIRNSSRKGATVLDPFGIGQHADRMCQNGEASPADRVRRAIRGCGGEEVAGFHRGRGGTGRKWPQFRRDCRGAAGGGRAKSGLNIVGMQPPGESRRPNPAGGCFRSATERSWTVNRKNEQGDSRWTRACGKKLRDCGRAE